MIRRPPRSTRKESSAASDVYKRQGYEFASSNLVNQIRDKLLPLVTILTPNIKELIALNCIDESGPVLLGNDQLAAELISLGVKSVLVTGTHADSNDVENRLYDFSGFLGSWTWPRLDNEYHGSGCTLASAIAGYLSLIHISEPTRRS